MLIFNEIIKDDKENIKGFVLVGSNNSGKTYQIIEIFKQMAGTINDREYEVKNAIFLSQRMNTAGIKFEAATSFREINEFKIDFFNDTIDGEEISKVIYQTIINNFNYYNNLIHKLLDMTLRVNEGGTFSEKELLIFTQEEADENPVTLPEYKQNEFSLKSSGYLSFIRIIVILDNLLNENVKWLLIDEPDAFLDVENRERFIEIIENIKIIKSSKAKVIFSSHNAETLYSLPENYIVYKLIKKKVTEKYYSQDFFSKAKLEETLFDMSGSEIYKSEIMKQLISIYKNKLEAPFSSYDNLSNYNYDELSIKEKIVYNAIKKL